jgi:hypothetical protein
MLILFQASGSRDEFKHDFQCIQQWFPYISLRNCFVFSFRLQASVIFLFFYICIHTWRRLHLDVKKQTKLNFLASYIKTILGRGLQIEINLVLTYFLIPIAFHILYSAWAHKIWATSVRWGPWMYLYMHSSSLLSRPCVYVYTHVYICIYINLGLRKMSHLCGVRLMLYFYMHSKLTQSSMYSCVQYVHTYIYIHT